MPELVYQTWERITGRPWSDAAAGGFTDGSYDANIDLQRRLLEGWDPYAPAAAPAPAPAPAAAPAPAPAPSPGPVPVDPGLLAQQWEAMLALQRETAQELARLEEERIRLQEERDADARRLQEAQLGANPADFVAYELYRRSLEEQGFTPQLAARSDVDIQNLFDVALDLNEGLSIGAGQFGVALPTTGSISRSEFQGFDPTDVGILSSFLRGGVETGSGWSTGGQFQGINPEDYFTELEEGFVPVLPQQRTQYQF